MAKKKMTEKDMQEWDDLYQYVRKNIMGYDENQALPSNMVLRLKGLLSGKFIENNNTKDKANYSYVTILNTFKFCSPTIQNALRANKFKDEMHKFNYILKIVESRINDVYIKTKKIEQQKESIKQDNDSRILEYVNTFKVEEDVLNKSNLYEDLW